MKKVILVLDGIVAKEFANIVLEKYFSNNKYEVVVNDPLMIPKNPPSNFTFHHFDATSSFKLQSVLDSEISDALIIMDNFEEKYVVFKNIRAFNKEICIVINIKESSEKERFKDEKTLIINEKLVLSSALVSRVPNVPLIPHGFGLGLGEIMEINVPLGSVFAYRHIGSIHQKNYKIIGIYRQNELILSNASLVIRPNDSLLVAGDPNVLMLIYKQIKSDIGQFPSPFGSDIYLYIDMKEQRNHAIWRDINQAIFLKQSLKNAKLKIFILNPSDFELLKEIEILQSPLIQIHTDYGRLSFLDRLKIDLPKKIGLLIVGKEFFNKKIIRKALFNAQIPVFKTSQKSLQNLKSCVVVVKEDMINQENISSVIFDVAIQAKLDILIYDFDPDGNFQDEIHTQYQNLSRMLDKKINIKKTSTKNPIIFLKDSKEPLLQFLPFESGVVNYKALSFLSTSVEKISHSINENPQIFIPIPD